MIVTPLALVRAGHAAWRADVAEPGSAGLELSRTGKDRFDNEPGAGEKMRVQLGLVRISEGRQIFHAI